MVDFIVDSKVFNGADLFSHDGSHNQHDRNSNSGPRHCINTATDTTEKTNSIEEKTKHRAGVFSQRAKEEETKDSSSHLRWTTDSSRYGTFGSGRRRGINGKNFTDANNTIRRRDDEKLKARHRKLRNISEFFGSSVSTQQTGLCGIRTTDRVHHSPVSFTAVENGFGTRTPDSFDVESQEMETDSSIDKGATTNSVDNVCRKSGDGGERMVGVDEDAKIDLADCSIEFRKIARETFVKFLGSTSRYISDICVPENGEEVIQFLADVRQLSGLSTTEQLRLVSIHDTHIHVVHSCSYSNSACRCTWLCGSGVWRNRRIPRHRRRVFIADVTVNQWEDVYRYFTSNGHAIQDIEGRGPNARLCLRLKNLQVRNFFLLYTQHTKYF